MSEATNQPPEISAKRGRGRPRKDSNWTTFAREDLVERALIIAGDEGFAAVTMHRLATEFKVTPRALYNYVKDRQEIINLAVELFLDKAPLIDFDPAHWQASVRMAYAESRRLHRAFPRASLVGMEENVNVTIGPRHALLVERLLQFYVDINLPLNTAVTMVRALEQDVLGFGLRFDYTYDRLPEEHKELVTRVMPESRLDAAAQVAAPQCRAALQLPGQTSDEMFEDLIELRIIAIEAILAKNVASH
ncbi:TetR/AcrR family transcriptional regulator [Glutamicibacter sp. AOP12-B1-11]|uniref:TetR/AcrR family transcriptional regulator n=1 Tax=Glutamicibacter sp. AOP12-B1-11 TaxID=3457725 RepID=UPI00403398BD